ncbi:MAG: cobaltochelatase subunit CobN [Alphaproteobacteria bacterium]
MHLLAAQPGGIADGSQAVDLGQTPGEIVVLSAADTELACLAAARARLGPGFPSLRLANLLNLTHNLSVDTYVEDVVAHAWLVVVRALGGVSYWRYGVEQVHAVCRERGIPLAFLPGDDQPDPELAAFSLLAPEATHRLWQYCIHGGLENATSFLGYAASLIGRSFSWREPTPLRRAGLYWPGLDSPDVEALKGQWRNGAPVAALVFYRALVQAANTAAVDALIEALIARGLNPLPVFAASLKDPVAAATVRRVLEEAPPAVVLNATGFALASPAGPRKETPFAATDCPVLQVVFAGSGEAAWREGTRGLSPRDIAMNVALPEVDGRILARAVSFKAAAHRDAETQTDIVAYKPVADRIEFVADLAAGWIRIRTTAPGERRVALILANYPNRDGRLGNGVGLDTPASAMRILKALAQAGYRVDDMPADGAALIARVAAGPTNDLAARVGRRVEERLPLADYDAFFATLPEAVRAKVTARWGPPERDPFVTEGAFAIGAFRLGNVAVGLQPARGYNIDPASTYHDPDLSPPHGYLAFYAWLKAKFGAHAVVHLGKHGNLEWLPGKALALSAECFPEAAFGPLPQLYPFIVNDPGEGTQAKRRTAAVIVDHLTPPLTRAESYGPLTDLEQLIDEYYEAAALDAKRVEVLKREILTLSQAVGLDVDCGTTVADDEAAALAKLDTYLCELKEMQIRDGLHVFGEVPKDDHLADLLVALVRVPRLAGEDGGASLTRALAADLGLDFDPLDVEMGQPWQGPRPAVLRDGAPWRTHGDTVERLEGLARALVKGEARLDPAWQRTRVVIAEVEERLRPMVQASGEAEIAALMAGLDGRFVAPGPSGAPTRGRSEVLPTGRNFYSVDARAVPTPTAFKLGWTSASLLVQRHLQEHGAWPRRVVLSAWGSANMRTGGEDVAQALALMGVRPTWEPSSGRVTGFEVLPVSVLDRPRVDVTVRVSGFFRDAFPNLIDLVDSAARAVAACDEAEEENPLAARVKADAEAFVAAGMAQECAQQRAGFRVFGSKPGAYGAGLQALIDERGWDDEGDLGRAVLTWGGYAYGDGTEGEPDRDLFALRLKSVEAVIHNQDNREHDLLDSDDYYQFEGGLTVAVRHLSGTQPTVYHNDHSRPDSPKIRTLEEEIARVVRARVVNPKWIAGVMRHGYKGAAEMAATVDYLFGFAATARAVKNHQFDAVFEAYVNDPDVQTFLTQANPAALKEMAERLIEAKERGLWRPRANIAHVLLEDLAGGGKEEP